ncbi:hypothetical protein AFAEC_1137 [Aliarcobacter faecis]|uniref:hypothetical protein n=1 Tax=Aliarcobacter faecis TaxID=1564138 RepID=UPI0004796598|nr:hypothetical protein [Aliarcobacter faecis]QKF73268.1 hypothetical protein AFAEC_1102 [Aliarcobacter faecis]QKF73303.1 hypothetical protein AFAEC_1137 [Aliarcobacter faecis]
MAQKKFIIKQKTNWGGRGEKSGTSTIQLDESEIAGYIALLEGEVEVYEQNLTLSVTGVSTATSSVNASDRVLIKHGVHVPIYVANSSRRPIVFKTPISNVYAYLMSCKPFPAPYSADTPKDVSLDTANFGLL